MAEKTRKPLISTEIGSFKRYGSNREIIKLLKDSGFEAYDFSMCLWTKESYLFEEDYAEKAKALRAYADSIGICCNQAHAPFPVYFLDNSWGRSLLGTIKELGGEDLTTVDNPAEEYERLLDKLISRAIEIAAILGSKAIVLHPNNDASIEENIAFYQRYQALAKKWRIKIALENMWNWDGEKDCASPAACSDPESFQAHLDGLDKEVFVACLDIGHAEMRGLNTSAVQMLTALGDRVACLHIHDNDQHFDLHKIPFSMKIDFYEIARTLKQIGYQGDLTFESEAFIARFDKEFYPIATKYLYQIGVHLREKMI